MSVCLCSVRARVRDLLLSSAVNFARRDWTDFHRISYLVIVNFFKFFRRRVRRIWLIGRSTVFGCLHRITFSVVGRQMCVVARLRWVTSRHGARPPETWDARQTGRRRMSVAGRRGTRTVSEGLRDDADGREEQRHRNVVRWQQETGQQQQQRQVPRVRRGLQPGTEAPRQDRILQAGTGRGRDRRVPVPRHVRHTRRHVGHVAATAATVPRVPEGSLSKSFGRGEFFEFETLCLPVLTEPLMALDVLWDNGRASCRVKKNNKSWMILLISKRRCDAELGGGNNEKHTLFGCANDFSRHIFLSKLTYLLNHSRIQYFSNNIVNRRLCVIFTI